MAVLRPPPLCRTHVLVRHQISFSRFFAYGLILLNFKPHAHETSRNENQCQCNVHFRFDRTTLHPLLHCTALHCKSEKNKQAKVIQYEREERNNYYQQHLKRVRMLALGLLDLGRKWHPPARPLRYCTVLQYTCCTV